MSNSDSEGFKLVSYKKGKRGKVSTVFSHGKEMCSSSNQVSSEHSSKIDHNKIKSLQYDMEKSDFFNDFKNSLNSILQKPMLKTTGSNLYEDICALSITDIEEPADIVCYGLGSFSSCLIARHQLAFLMALKDFLMIKTLDIYDPVFSSNEKDCLIKLGFNVLSLNEKAKRSVNRRTIFFMPHCDLPLYNNLLWSNWSLCQIIEVIVIGNSFSNHKYLRDSRLKESGGYVNLSNIFVTEIKLSNNYIFKDVFNDMSIHYFTEELLSKVPIELWLKRKEPIYGLEDSINYS